MKKHLPELLQGFLRALLPGLCVLSLLLWRSGVTLGLLWAVPLLLLWAALLTGADRVVPAWGPLLLCIPAALCVLLFSDRDALAKAVSAAIRFGPVTPSASVNALILLLSGIAAALGISALRRFPLRCALSLCLAGAWIAAAFHSAQLPRLAIVSAVPILLDTAAGLLSRRHGAEDAAPPVMLLPVFTAAALLLFAAPSDRAPYPYPIIRSVLNRIESAYQSVETELFYRRRGEEEYSLSFNGIDESADPRDSAKKEQSDRVFYLSAAPRTYGVFYLSGSTWNQYDGQEWHSTVDRGMIDFLGWSMDTAEKLYALWRWNKSAEEPFYPGEDQLLLRYNAMNTRTLFTCADTFFIGTNTSRFPYTSRPSRVLFNYVQERDAWYRLFLLRPGTLRPDALAAASQGYGYDPAGRMLWGEVLTDFHDAYGLSLDRSESVESQLAQRESFIRSSYLALPEDVSDRVTALAAEITAGCTNDLERLDAVARYLQDGYGYTLTPVPAPEGTPFLDYFLFDAREGYCTWFATAAAILARAAGVPTRYVQGYRAVLNPGETAVLNDDPGHAWCEGYIGGYGWVVVEATPGYIASTDELFGADFLSQSETLPAAAAAPAEAPPELPQEEQPEETPQPRSLVWLPILIGLALLAVPAALLLRRARLNRRYLESPYSYRARQDLQRLSGYLARRGYPKSRTESLREWFSRVRWHYLLLDADEAMRFALLYEEMLFAGRKLTEAEWQAQKDFVDGLRPRRRFL